MLRAARPPIRKSINYFLITLPATKSERLLMRRSPQHLWLNIACIDQENEDMKVSEIVRQASIFAKPETAFIWLSHYQTAQLQRYLQGFIFAIDDLESSERNSAESNWADRAFAVLSHLLQDPQFSSLWTLQEAFLRKDALLLSAQGEAIGINRYSRVDLRLLTLYYYPLSIFTESDLNQYLYKAQVLTVLKIQDLIRRSGLRLLYFNSLVTLYTGARFRSTVYEIDRIYGIMQIFKFRLGATAPQKTKKIFQLNKLEDQLGAALLEKWPVRSQIHIHTEPAPCSRAQRIGQTSELPKLVPQVSNTIDQGDFGKAICQLSTLKVNGVTQGFFQGFVTEFSKLAIV